MGISDTQAQQLSEIFTITAMQSVKNGTPCMYPETEKALAEFLLKKPACISALAQEYKERNDLEQKYKNTTDKTLVDIYHSEMMKREDGVVTQVESNIASWNDDARTARQLQATKDISILETYIQKVQPMEGVNDWWHEMDGVTKEIDPYDMYNPETLDKAAKLLTAVVQQREHFRQVKLENGQTVYDVALLRSKRLFDTCSEVYFTETAPFNKSVTNAVNLEAFSPEVRDIVYPRLAELAEAAHPVIALAMHGKMAKVAQNMQETEQLRTALGQHTAKAMGGNSVTAALAVAAAGADGGSIDKPYLFRSNRPAPPGFSLN